MGVTLSSLRISLATRLGFSTDGQPAIRQRAILDELIRDAQEFVYWNTSDDRYSKTVTVLTGLGQSLFDLPDDMETLKPLRVWWRDPAASRYWNALARDGFFGSGLFESSTEDTDLMGHTPFMRALAGETPSGELCAYRIVGDQLEVAPAAERAGLEVRVDYSLRLPLLRDDADTLMMDQALVFRLALVNAKAHYQQADGTLIGKQFEAVQGQIRAGQHVDRRYPSRAYVPGYRR